jgi:group II intron reverse transcriptase/maturase
MSVEGRGPVTSKWDKGNDVIQPSTVKQTSATKLTRVELRSRQNPDEVFTNLGHILDVDLLRECYRRLDGSRAVGIDGITKETYGEGLEGKLAELIQRLRRGTYIPQSSRIVEISKVDGTKRPLAIACTEDKIVQDAVRCVLERVFEPTFADFSYGFRPGRNCHMALVALDQNLMRSDTGAVLDVDIRQCFSSIPHGKLAEILSRKIADKRFLHLVLKLIKAETVNDDGVAESPSAGTPQGSILSPLLSNVFLHEAIDTWFVATNRDLFAGRCTIVRYADDMVFTTPNEEVAVKLQAALSDRLKEFGLELNPGKTRVLVCGRKPAAALAERGERMPALSFLGFLHVWGKSINRRTGKAFWRIKRRTCPKRFRAKILGIKHFLRKNRHDKQLIERMKAVVRGYLNYFAINDNSRRINQFVAEVRRLIFKWLNRRSQKRSFTWEKFAQILEKVNFPKPVIIHDLFFNSSAYRRT